MTYNVKHAGPANVYIQGSVDHESNIPYLLFNVTAVALKDKRINKLRMKESKNHRKGHIISGHSYYLLPKRDYENRYFILDKKENMLGVITKSGRHSGWWYFQSMKIFYVKYV